MGELTLYFDRCCGKQFPIHVARLKPPFVVKSHYEEGFPHDVPDDEWLRKVGPLKWVVISHDSRFHLDLPAIKAIEQYRIGCFYMWGGQLPDWNKVGFLASVFPKMKAIVGSERRPFIHRVLSTGNIKLVRRWHDNKANGDTTEDRVGEGA